MQNKPMACRQYRSPDTGSKAISLLPSGRDQDIASSHTDVITAAIRDEREQERQIRRIVCLLMDRFDIPDGDQFITSFGDGSETDNREAITNWVRQLLPEISPANAEMRLRDCLNRRVNAARFEIRHRQ